MKKNSFTERRRFLRLPVTIGIYYKAMDETLDTAGLKTAKATNVSLGGVLFNSVFRIAAGSVIQMKLDFTYRRKRHQIPLLAKVVRCRPGRGRGFQIGAEYVEAFPKDLALLNRLVADMSAKHK